MIRSEYYNNTLCLQAGWLFENGIITERNYYQLTYRGRLNILRRGGGAGPALIEWHSMPERFKDAVLKHGDPYKMTYRNKLLENITPSKDAQLFFDSYRLADGRGLKPEVKREYYANAIILNAIHSLLIKENIKPVIFGIVLSAVWQPELVISTVQTVRIFQKKDNVLMFIKL